LIFSKNRYMAEIVYKLISDGADPLLEQVKPLFAEMYRGMQAQGLMLPLADDGADTWLEGALATLGRFGIIAVAVEEDRLAGFAHGALKFLPDHLDGHKTGVVTHIYIKPGYRGQNTGRHLLELLEVWFAEKEVHSVELQVIAGNDARGFWERCGYSLELYQYRKFTGEQL
jgi:GNAT superfamily N-acetyltransferase